jgi:hypothetical protein
LKIYEYKTEIKNPIKRIMKQLSRACRKLILFSGINFTLRLFVPRITIVTGNAIITTRKLRMLNQMLNMFTSAMYKSKDRTTKIPPRINP